MGNEIAISRWSRAGRVVSGGLAIQSTPGIMLCVSGLDYCYMLSFSGHANNNQTPWGIRGNRRPDLHSHVDSMSVAPEISAESRAY